MTHQGTDPARYPESTRPPVAGDDAPESISQFASRTPIPIAINPPQLLLHWESRPKAFFRNLFDLLFFRRPAPIQITAKPARFWSDVFVEQRVSFRALADSFLVHVFLVVTIIGFTETYILWRPPELHDGLAHRQVITYEISEYLPEVHTTEEPKAEDAPKTTQTAKIETPADPVYAKQEIISVPPDPDNLKQTIVTPSQIRIRQDIPLPNIVTAQPPKAPDVLEVANRPAPKLETPPEILAPKLKVNMAPPEIADASVPKPVQALEVANRPAPKSLMPPAVDAPKLKIGMAMPEVATGAVPKAAPTPVQVANGRVRKNDATGPEVAAPSLKGSVAAPTFATNATPQLPKPAAAPTPVSTATTNGAGKTPEAAQQIIALSTTPTSANGALAIPEGSRRGTFAAGPTGSADAKGAPAASTAKSPAANSATGAPSGIHVAAVDAAPHAGVVAAGTPSDLKNRMIAMAAVPPTIPPQRVQPEAKLDDDPTARRVFGEKRFYKMTVNMPNLTSASGSWVLRFAELHPELGKAQIGLAAPVALTKSDPGYPQDLMKDKVEGTVVLYAIIRADGSITDVKVINSVNERLDESAIAALKRWRFRPGSKENQAVDVEAVVQVPFKVKKLGF